MVKKQNKIIQLPTEKLSITELKGLSSDARDAYVERYLLKLLELNKESGLTQREIHMELNHLSAPTLYKHLEGLIAKRQIYKVRTGMSVNYFPNHRPLHPLVNKNIQVDENKKFRFQLVEIESDLSLYLQEIERDFLGREEIKGGVLIPLRGIKSISEYLSQLSQERPMLIEEFKKTKMEELNKKLYGGDKHEF